MTPAPNYYFRLISLSCGQNHIRLFADPLVSSPEEDYVIACRFRPVANLACIEAFRQSLSSLHQGNHSDEEDCADSCVHGEDVCRADGTCAEETPVPRSLRAMPPPSPQSQHPAEPNHNTNAHLKNEYNEDYFQDIQHPQVIKLNLDRGSDSDLHHQNDRPASPPSEQESDYQQTIRRQANELDELRRQVQQLQEILLAKAAAQPSMDEALKSSPAPKKAKKSKKNKNSNIAPAGVDDPILSQLNNFLALAKQQQNQNESIVSDKGSYLFPCSFVISHLISVCSNWPKPAAKWSCIGGLS